MRTNPVTSRLLIIAAAIILPLLLLGLLVLFLQPSNRAGYPIADGGTPALPPSATLTPRAMTATTRPLPSATLPVPSLATSLPATATSPPPPASATLIPTAPPAGPPSPTAPVTDQAPTAAVSSPAAPTALPIETPQPAAWQHRSTAHYDLYYLPSSPAAHDIDLLATTAEGAMTWAAAHLQASPNTRIRIYFVNRIFWQGGASYSHNELLLSYAAPDREYTATSLVLVLRHETTHALVEQMLGSDVHKGGLLGEGVAVWDAGGHYQVEDLPVLASTLIADNAPLYLPLADLQRDFYGAQHEIAYLEGGAYVTFLIDRWGLPKFKRYLDQPDNPQPIYGLALPGLEQAWRAGLAATPHTAADSEAVRLRVRYYDLMRRYETTRDPDARLLPNQPPSQWGPILIGLFSHPAPAPANVALEHDFVRAGAALWSRDLATCTQLLDSIAARLP